MWKKEKTINYCRMPWESLDCIAAGRVIHEVSIRNQNAPALVTPGANCRLITDYRRIVCVVADDKATLKKTVTATP